MLNSGVNMDTKEIPSSSFEKVKEFANYFRLFCYYCIFASTYIFNKFFALFSKDRTCDDALAQMIGRQPLSLVLWVRFWLRYGCLSL